MNRNHPDACDRSAAEVFASIRSYPCDFLGVHQDGESRERWEELMRYVALSTATSKSYPMASSQVDELWHAFILHTESYIEFCSRFLGGYFHHRPASSATMPPVPATEFQADYERAFVRPLSPLWDRVTADCSSCGGSGCSH